MAAHRRDDSEYSASQELRWSSPAPRAARLPVSSGSRRRIVRRHFQTSIVHHESDAETFKEFLMLPVPSSVRDEHNGVLTLMDMDTLNRAFPAELFHAYSMNDDGHESSFIGSSSTAGGSGSSQRGALPSTTNLSSDWPVPLIPEHQAFGLLNVLLDGVTLEVLGCTVQSMVVTGPLTYKSKFGNMVVNLNDFQQWLHISVNLLLCDCEEEVQPFDMVLAPQTAKQSAKFEFHMKTNLIQAEVAARVSAMNVEHVLAFADDEYEILCLLEFGDLEMHRHGKHTDIERAPSSSQQARM